MPALYGEKRVRDKKRCSHSKSIEIEKLRRKFAMNKTKNIANEKVIMTDNSTKIIIKYPENVPDVIRQEKINRIYDILTKHKLE